MGCTIKDVAKAANVSVATVSYVINKTKPVSKETRERVLKAVAELGYMPSSVARSMKGKKSRTIGYISPTYSTKFYSNVFSVCGAELAKSGYRILGASSNFDLETERLLINSTLSRGVVDGLIVFTSAQNTEELEKELPKDFPSVILDAHFPFSADGITHTFADALSETVSYYQRNGHKQAALFSGVPGLSSVQEQRKAFQRALKHYDMPCDTELYDGEMPRTKEAVLQFAERNHCTALCFIDFDRMFNMFYDANTQGILIPPEFDVVCGSEDETDYMLQTSIPRIIVPTKDIGVLAAKQILYRIKEEESGMNRVQAQRIILPCGLRYPQ